MTGYSFDWVDAFTTEAFGGNGCVVVHDAVGLPQETRMALVRETSLSECAYLVGSAVADFGARYYLAEREIPMAGHPTIATVRALLHRGLIDLSAGSAEITLEVGAGVLPIRIVDNGAEPLITMTQAAPVFGARCDPAEIAAIYGLHEGDVVGIPQIVSTGTPFCIALLSGKSAQDAARLDVEKLKAWQARQTIPNAALMEPFLVTLGGATEAGDTYSRLLLPPPMPTEDPFTGSATGCMAAYLWAEGHLNAASFVAEQGHGMGRPGAAHVRVLGPRDAISGVDVGGQGRVLMSGVLDV